MVYGILKLTDGLFGFIMSIVGQRKYAALLPETIGTSAILPQGNIGGFVRDKGILPCTAFWQDVGLHAQCDAGRAAGTAATKPSCSMRHTY